MNKIGKIVFGLTMLGSWCSCNSNTIVYQGHTRFLYSLDGQQNTWSETVQEISVGTTYYLAVEMRVTQSKETNDEKIIKADITIPNTSVLDCYLDDHPGVTITGMPDLFHNSITYTFNLVSAVSPEKFRVVFECTPLAAGRANVLVVYDDNVSESWDVTGTIKYVNSESENPSSANSASESN